MILWPYTAMVGDRVADLSFFDKAERGKVSPLFGFSMLIPMFGQIRIGIYSVWRIVLVEPHSFQFEC